MTRRLVNDARTRAVADSWDLDAARPLTVSGDAPDGPADGVAYAELPVRVFGLLLDVALFAIIAEVGSRVALWLAQSSLTRTSSGTSNDLAGLFALALPLGAIVGSQMAIVVVSLRRYQATPGQMAFGLFTLGRDSGVRLTRGQALLRWPLVYGPVVLFLSGSLFSATLQQIGAVAKNPLQSTDGLNSVLLWAPILWGVIVIVSIVIDGRNRGLHDRLTGAVVVRRSGRSD